MRPAVDCRYMLSVQRASYASVISSRCYCFHFSYTITWLSSYFVQIYFSRAVLIPLSGSHNSV